MVDYFTAVFFTIEYFTRLACCPKKMRFFVQPVRDRLLLHAQIILG